MSLLCCYCITIVTLWFGSRDVIGRRGHCSLKRFQSPLKVASEQSIRIEARPTNLGWRGKPVRASAFKSQF